MVANAPDDEESGEYPAIPDGMDAGRVEVSEAESCVFCGAPLWKDLVEEEEHGLEDRWFCTEYQMGEHEPEQQAQAASRLGLEKYRPEPGGVYAAPEGIVALAEEPSRDDPNLCYGIACEGTGAGGASLLRMRVLPWDQYIELSDSHRELVHANHDILVEPPVEWQNYVLKHVLAFASQDDWMASWLWEGAVDWPDVEWKLEPYWSAEEEARKPKNIDDVYEKYEELDSTVSYKEPTSGELYLRRTQPVVYTLKSVSLNRQQNACGLRIGPMTAVEVQLDEVQLLPFELGVELDDYISIEFERGESAWGAARSRASREFCRASGGVLPDGDAAEIVGNAVDAIAGAGDRIESARPAN